MYNMIRAFYHKLNAFLFVIAGMRPWSRGYAEYKERYIKEKLKEKSFQTDRLPNGYGFRIDERVIEYPWLFSRLSHTEGRLLDAGSVLNFDYLLDDPLLQNKKIFISTLAPELSCHAEKGVSYVYEDLRDSCFRDNYFDWIVSLSTLEHIGLDNTMLYTSDDSKRENETTTYLRAIGEYHRMLKPGGSLYLSVPFGHRKNHGWFQVFDSEMLDELIRIFMPTRHHEFHYKYMPDGWVCSTRDESKEASCFDIHVQNSYDKDFAAFSRAVVCMELIK